MNLRVVRAGSFGTERFFVAFVRLSRDAGPHGLAGAPQGRGALGGAKKGCAEPWLRTRGQAQGVEDAKRGGRERVLGEVGLAN